MNFTENDFVTVAHLALVLEGGLVRLEVLGGLGLVKSACLV